MGGSVPRSSEPSAPSETPLANGIGSGMFRGTVWSTGGRSGAEVTVGVAGSVGAAALASAAGASSGASIV